MPVVGCGAETPHPHVRQKTKAGVQVNVRGDDLKESCNCDPQSWPPTGYTAVMSWNAGTSSIQISRYLLNLWPYPCSVTAEAGSEVFFLHPFITHWSLPSAGPPGTTSETVMEVSPSIPLGRSRPPEIAMPKPLRGSCMEREDVNTGLRRCQQKNRLAQRQGHPLPHTNQPMQARLKSKVLCKWR